MPNLTPFADRMEDTEISANKPLTETLFTKFGKNINFLLDFLGVSDGETSPSGSINDLANAVSVIEGHTITKQVTAASNTTTVVGTYTPIKFVDRVFYARAEEPFPLLGGFPRSFMKSIDGGPNVIFDAAKTTPGSTSTTPPDPEEAQNIFGTRRDLVTGATFQIDSSAPRRRFFDGAVGAVGFESTMRSGEWAPIATLSWRDFNTNAVVRSYHEGPPAHIYMAYTLNLTSNVLS